MRLLLFVLTVFGLMGLAFWAYRENYATQAQLREIARLRSEIADLSEALAVQRTEWAYLNRPDRLRDLVALNFDRVPLLPLDPLQFQPVDRVTPPPRPSVLDGLDDGAVDISGELPVEEDPL
jgi:hypothetical protein